jgi:acyl phosphate:glycerol-3-phosphate acyltransferase
LTVLLLVVAYLIGSVPAGYLAGRWARGIDLRDHGSGNLGATNTFRVLGPKLAVPVLLFDLGKGLLAAGLFPRLDGSDALAWSLAYGAAAILGHIFPIFMRFRGGKGVATAAGVFIALSPASAGVAFLVWATVLGLGRIMSLASLGGAVALVVALPLLDGRLPLVLLGIAIATVVIIAHRANIARLLRGEERGVRSPDRDPSKKPEAP